MKKKFLTLFILLFVSSFCLLCGCETLPNGKNKDNTDDTKIEEPINDDKDKDKETQYTIEFKNGDVVLQTLTVKKDVKPEYTGATPTKTATAEYSYKFNGWDKEIVPATSDAVYNAVFKEEKVLYEALFKNADGSDLLKVNVEYGKTPSYVGANPTKEGKGNCSYEFKCWDKEFTAITENTVYNPVFYAVYDNTKSLVAFLDDGETVVSFTTGMESLSARDVEKIIYDEEEVSFTILEDKLVVDTDDIEYSKGDDIIFELVGEEVKSKVAVGNYLYMDVENAEDLVAAVDTTKRVYATVQNDITYGRTDLTTNALFKKDFKGVLDGNKHTLTFNVAPALDHAVDSVFERVSGTIKNVKIEATVNSPYLSTYHYCFAYIVSGTIENSIIKCNFDGATYGGYGNMGAICELSGSVNNCVIVSNYNLANAVAKNIADTASIDGVLYVAPFGNTYGYLFNEYKNTTDFVYATSMSDVSSIGYIFDEDWTTSSAIPSSYVSGFVFAQGDVYLEGQVIPEPPVTLITTAEEFDLAMATGTGRYKLANDITVTKTGMTTDQLYRTTFSGVLDGNGKTLTISMATDQCYFDSMFKDISGTIKNIKMVMSMDTSYSELHFFAMLSQSVSGTIEDSIFICNHDEGIIGYGNFGLINSLTGSVNNCVIYSSNGLARAVAKTIGDNASIDGVVYVAPFANRYSDMFAEFKNTTNFAYITSFAGASAKGDTFSATNVPVATADIASSYVSGFEFTDSDVNFATVEE